jgi:tetratricopeptide (TPR) repeat protein
MQDPTPFLAEGEARLAVQDWDGAVAAFRQAVSTAPSSALAHNKLGIAYAHARRWDDAFEEFSRAIGLDPRFAQAHSNLGNLHRERGGLDEAVRCYTRAIAADPEYWIAHQNLGVVYKQQGRLADAVREFKTAARLSLRAPGPAQPGAGPRRVAERPRLGCLGTGGIALILVALAGLRR